MNFKIGDIVVCVNDAKTNPRIDMDFQQWIKRDEKYTIRATSMDLNGQYGVLLEEIKNEPIYLKLLGGSFEPRFASNRFRKIEDDTLKNEKVEELEACY